MDKLKSMQVFVHVVQHGSFSGAATSFAVTSTMIGKYIKFLETHLGTKLINRTTRRQSLTETGQLYYLECRRILDDIAEAENSLQTLENKPKGKVRINSPVTFGNIVLAPIVADFLQQYPDINIELTLDNDLIDPLHEQVDVVIRIGGLASSSLIARQIAVYEMVFCASPDYLAKHRIPLSLTDLTNHQCLGFSYGDIQASLALQIDTQAFDKQHSRLTSNSGQALKVATLKGAGILLQPRLLLSEDLVRGELIEILSDQVPTPSPIHLMYKSKALSLKTRVFIEFVMAAMSRS
ncbi:LysR family transcriptional regulator [Shewanella benthica]|uniref:LysR family transcriptional regulator n=1 Tax=Shewanella benthica TaxID=43661 RepID=UPI0018792946|nr:LysR family transcriptional regulator [Shewanella benthica]MBE7215704.1 LysR family transcriptional regulator [Shewanella benthica]MCL1062790.1 LysR family transcriptional regulator [Shewanella benthica]